MTVSPTARLEEYLREKADGGHPELKPLYWNAPRNRTLWEGLQVRRPSLCDVREREHSRVPATCSAPADLSAVWHLASVQLV